MKNTLAHSCAVMLALVAVACGSDKSGSSSSGCTTPEIVGSVFGGTGTATVTGTGTLPNGIADGLEVGILLSMGGVSVGLLPDDILATNDRVCGKTVKYTAKKVDAGTYRLAFDVFDPNSNSNSTLFEGEDQKDFTVAEGQSITVDASFSLTPKQ